MTVAGVDLGGSKIAGVLLDDSGAVRGEVWQEHQIAGPDEAVDLIAEVVGELSGRELAVTGPARALTAVGLSVAGGSAATGWRCGPPRTWAWLPPRWRGWRRPG